MPVPRSLFPYYTLPPENYPCANCSPTWRYLHHKHAGLSLGVGPVKRSFISRINFKNAGISSGIDSHLGGKFSIACPRSNLALSGYITTNPIWVTGLGFPDAGCSKANLYACSCVRYMVIFSSLGSDNLKSTIKYVPSGRFTSRSYFPFRYTRVSGTNRDS